MMRSYRRLFIYFLLLAAVLSGCEAQPLSKASLSAEPAAETSVLTAAVTPAAMPTTEVSAEPTTDRSANIEVLPDIDVDIPEKMFVTQMNDIVIRSEDYPGKVIRYEGLFAQYHSHG